MTILFMEAKKDINVSHHDHGKYTAFVKGKVYPFVENEDKFLFTFDARSEVHKMRMKDKWTHNNFVETDYVELDEFTHKRLEKLLKESSEY